MNKKTPKSKKPVKRKPKARTVKEKQVKTKPEIEEPIATTDSSSYVENEDFNFEVIIIPSVPVQKPDFVEDCPFLRSVKRNFRRIITRLNILCGRGGQEENSN